MNVIARLEYELAYFDSAVHRFNHYTTRTSPQCLGQETKSIFHHYLLRDKIVQNCSSKFRWQFNFNNYPKKRQIYRLIDKFQAEFSLNNFNKKAKNPISGRKLTARCPDNVDAVRDSVGKSLKKSLQRRSQELGLSPASLQKILKKGLQQYPYRIPIRHESTPADMEFLISVINHYHINGLHLFWDTLYIILMSCFYFETHCIWSEAI